MAASSSSASGSLSAQMRQLSLSNPRPADEQNWRTVKGKNRAVEADQVVTNAHADDIHGLARLVNNTFVSGSKDTSLRIWKDDGSLVETLSSSDKGYEYWITALAPFQNGGWASGTRDGLITVWSAENKSEGTILYNPFSKNHICKNRNKTRINCLREWKQANGETLFFSGTPEYVQVWNATTRKLVEYFKARNNDWVYCTEPLPNEDLLVVIGAELEKWHWTETNHIEKEILIRESNEEKVARQRPHISSIAILESNSSHTAAACFDGKLKIIDHNTKAPVQTYNENRGRLWTVINLGTNVIGSCADDSTIKLWDIRQNRSIHTTSLNNGRVSAMLKLNENRFVTGSCPDNPHSSSDKASLSFWDIRKLLPQTA